MASQIRTLNPSMAGELPYFSAKVHHKALTANTASSFTIPAGCGSVRVQYTAGTLFLNDSGTTAAVPAADVTNGTGSQMIPQDSSWSCMAGRSVSLINATACVVMFLLYGDGSGALS